jgi:septal ring factor EnvC (AmiA/AmiB activator)
MWRTAKDRLIEYLEQELARARASVQELTQERDELAQKLAAQVRTEVPKAAPRTEAEWCRLQSERSYKRAQLKNPMRNLVAELPPPGAHRPA